MVVSAAEIRGKGSGRIRMKRIAAGARDSVTTFVREVVEKGGGVGSDGRQSSRSLPEHGYRHTRRIVAGRAKEASTLLPRVQRVASLLKRWLLGTHHGAVRRSTSTPTWMNAPFVSIDAPRNTEGSSSTA